MPKSDQPQEPQRHFRVLHGGVGKFARGDEFAAYQCWDPSLDPEWEKQADRLLELGAIEEIDPAEPAQAPEGL